MTTRRSFLVDGLGWSAAAVAGGSACSSRKELPNTTKGKKEKPFVVGMIAKSQSNPVFIAARRGAEHACAQLSLKLNRQVELDWRTPNDEDPQKQAEFIEQLAASGADALAVACSDASKLTRAIDAAVARGVVVLCFDSDAPESKRLCYVGTDDVEAGRRVMAETVELLKGREGSIAILAGNQTATNLQRRVRGAEEELKKHTGFKLKQVYYHKETPQDAYAQVESVQKADPGVVGWAMIGGWPLMTERPLPWKPGEMVCVSMDTLPMQLQHVRMGDVQVLLGQRYYYFGGQCVSLLLDKKLEGKDPKQAIEFAPLDRVTTANVDEYAKNWDLWS
ncbi:MAG: substrate-binding domain-containing protein [Planctomycetia bacterium]